MMKKTLTLLLMFAATQSLHAQSKYIQAVDEYMPAPGQFVNTLPVATADDTPQTMAEKCTERLADGKGELVTLGAYGGYITFHFDHPVLNVEGKHDFAVWGNAFTNNAEPAIVLVSVDENGNSLPDDTWYELRGSEYDNPQTIHDYTVTYTFSSLADIEWTDNKGNTGKVARNPFHRQEYFPLWLTAEQTLTFSGARLPDNASLSGTMYILPAYEYGYADNQPNNNAEGCALDIAWAVDKNGQPVQLDHVDFIRCYNAMNQSCPGIGETSTEISGAEDLNTGSDIPHGIVDVKIKNTDETAAFDLQGRPVGTRRQSHGIYIVNGKKVLY